MQEMQKVKSEVKQRLNLDLPEADQDGFFQAVERIEREAPDLYWRLRQAMMQSSEPEDEPSTIYHSSKKTLRESRSSPSTKSQSVFDSQRKVLQGRQQLANGFRGFFYYRDPVSEEWVLDSRKVWVGLGAALLLVGLAYVSMARMLTPVNTPAMAAQPTAASEVVLPTQPSQAVLPQEPPENLAPASPPVSNPEPPLSPEPVPPLPMPSELPPLIPAQVMQSVTQSKAQQNPVALTQNQASKTGLAVLEGSKPRSLGIYQAANPAKTAVQTQENQRGLQIVQSKATAPTRASLLGDEPSSTPSPNVSNGNAASGMSSLPTGWPSVPPSATPPSPGKSPSLPPGMTLPPVGGSALPNNPMAGANLPLEGSVWEASLVLGVLLAEGGSVPAVAKDTEGRVWVGKASLNAARRVQIAFDRLSQDGQVQAVSASAYSQGYPGLGAQFREEAPALAADLLRGAMGGVAEYAKAAAQQTRVRIQQGGTVVETVLPGIATFVGGAVADLFAVKAGEKAMVRLAEVAVNTPLQIVVVGGAR